MSAPHDSEVQLDDRLRDQERGQVRSNMKLSRVPSVINETDVIAKLWDTSGTYPSKGTFFVPIASKADAVDLQDWSGTGKGIHIDFEQDDVVPLKQGMVSCLSNHSVLTKIFLGHFLGRGFFGDIYETTIKDMRVAHKKIITRSRHMARRKQEIEILKRVPHNHIVEYIGSYTHRNVLGILYRPVALCDLLTFFEDVEEYWSASENDETLSPISRARLEALGYFETKMCN